MKKKQKYLSHEAKWFNIIWKRMQLKCAFCGTTQILQLYNAIGLWIANCAMYYMISIPKWKNASQSMIHGYNSMQVTKIKQRREHGIKE